MPRFSDGQLEALKWIALASMFTDHIGRHLLGAGQDTWVFAAGRVAFPLFALVLGANLARPGDRAERSARVALRLALWALISQGPAVAARGEPLLVNIFGTLALGATMCWVLEARMHLAWRLVLTAGVALAAHWCEFDLMGAFLAPAVFAWHVTQRREAAVAALVVFGAVAAQNGYFGGAWGWGGTLLAAAAATAVLSLPLTVPRLRWLFYAIYPLHLAVIGLLKRF
jgi:hypothetical protein